MDRPLNRNAENGKHFIFEKSLFTIQNTDGSTVNNKIHRKKDLN